MHIDFEDVKKKVAGLMDHFHSENSGKDNLVAFFHRTLRDTAICEKYISDSERDGDLELAEFFKEIQAQDRLRAWRTEELMRHRLFSR